MPCAARENTVRYAGLRNRPSRDVQRSLLCARTIRTVMFMAHDLATRRKMSTGARRMWAALTPAERAARTAPGRAVALERRRRAEALLAAAEQALAQSPDVTEEAQ